MNLSDLKNYTVLPSSSTTSSTAPTAEPVKPKKSILDKTTDVVTSIFPGKQLGEALGNSINGVTQSIKQGSIQPALQAGQENSNNYSKIAGDTAQIPLAVAGPLVGGATPLARIGANTALGVGIGATNSIANGGSAKDVLKEGAVGGALGGGLSIAGEGISALAKNLPSWLAKAALPKLASKDTQYALEKVKIGNISSMAKKSGESIKNYESQIQGVLSHPEFSNVAVDTNSILEKAVSTFPNSEYASKDLIDNAKNIAPNVAKLITKLEAGQANIQEINTIRKELDRATASVYTTLNRPPETKLLGAALSNSLRDYVQTTAPSTASIFSDYSKEVGLNKALQTALKKNEARVSLKDIAAGSAGAYHGGFTGMLEAIIAERLLTSPGAQIGAAKVIQGASKGITPVAKAAFQAGKAPLIKKVTN